MGNKQVIEITIFAECTNEQAEELSEIMEASIHNASSILNISVAEVLPAVLTEEQWNKMQEVTPHVQD